MTVLRRMLMMLAMLAAFVQSASALSLSLDSIAAWGKFPRFCVDVYRWGDGFFNGYDTAYVVGTGYKFNAKLLQDSWIDNYKFYFPEDVSMSTHSDPSTSVGFRLGYLAVSVGYDKNISRFFGGPETNRREQFSAGFNCSLFTFNMFIYDNTGGQKIYSFGPKGNRYDPDIEFDGLRSKAFGFEAYYFFNHKKYSQAAAFRFSRVQIKSQGSAFAGVNFENQSFDFDFGGLPPNMKDVLPSTWTDYQYHANTKNISLKGGYGYNWVFAPKWVVGVSESPSAGIRVAKGNNGIKTKVLPIFANDVQLSVVWNNKQWFAGAMGQWTTSLLTEKGASFQPSHITGSFHVGYRFNLW